MASKAKTLFSHLDLKTPPSTPFLERGPDSTAKKRRSKKAIKTRSNTQPQGLIGRKSILVVNIVIILFLYLNGFVRIPWQKERGLEQYQSFTHNLSEQLESCMTEVDETDRISSGLLRDLLNTDNFQEEFERLRTSISKSEENIGIDNLKNTLEDMSRLLQHQADDRQAWKKMTGGLEVLWRGMINSECVCNNPEALDAQYAALREAAQSRVEKG